MELRQKNLEINIKCYKLNKKSYRETLQKRNFDKNRKMKRIIALTLLVITLNAYKAIACVGPVGSVAKIVCLADSLKSTLTSTQIASLQLSYSYANGQVWSNLPTTMQTRLGISLGSLNTQQLSIAKLLIKEISGTTQAEGYEEFEQLLLADEYLKKSGSLEE